MVNKIIRISWGILVMGILIYLLQTVYKPIYQILISTMPKGPFTIPAILDPNTLSIIVAFFGILAIIFSLVVSTEPDDYNY